MNVNEQLETRKQEIVDAFETVIDFIELCVEEGEVPPEAVFGYLWKKKFRLQDLNFEE